MDISSFFLPQIRKISRIMFSAYGCILHDLPWNSIIKKVTARCTPPAASNLLLCAKCLYLCIFFLVFLPIQTLSVNLHTDM